MSTQNINTTVLIVGGGPVGILAGLLLEKLGVDFQIVEQRATLHQAPQAHVISARSLEICRAVGIDDMTIRAPGPTLQDTSSVRWVDRLIGRDLGVFRMDRDLSELERMLSQTPTPITNLSQDQFEKILFDRLCDTAGESKLLFEHTWEGFDKTDDGYVSSISNPDGEIKVSSRYLIGADGAGSRVRKAAGIKMVGPDNIQTFINIHFSANLREQLSGREGLLYWVMDEEVSGTFIAHDIDSNWIFMKTVDEGENIDPIDEAKFESLLRKAIGIDIPLTVNSMNAWRMTAQIAEGYQKDHLFLVGDAAHRFPPTGGIGMNTGFQDVHNLTWKIAMVENGANPDLLNTYEPERKPIAETNSSQSLNNAMKMIEVAVALDVDGDKTISAADIDAVCDDKARLAAVQAAVDAQAAHFNMSGLDLGVCYSGKAVIEDGEPPLSEDPVSIYQPSTTPGTRLPHAMLVRDTTPLSTLDLVRLDRFLLLAHADENGALSAAVDTANNAGKQLQLEVVNESSGLTAADDAFATLCPPNEVLLVRPDGHIAARFGAASAAEELDKALGSLM